MQLKDLSPAEAELVVALLDEALDLPQDQRCEWQAVLARREPKLCQLVLDLLTSKGGCPGRPAIETGDFLERHFRNTEATPASLEGRLFGPYRVMRLLGQGGMGSVWLAQRSDGLFARQVALKLVHAGLADWTFGERFIRERNILAALNHPNIARLLDAGVADDGQPYLALEYVAGVPLTAYCDSKRLTIAARIELVIQVLTALDHAHRNLTIHRDLKPSNILVTEQGQVRLLDFGIAKLMTDGEAHETELTQLGGRALTPEYASPEQIAGQPVNTASDVYSVGILLYGLLCGHRPYQLSRDSRGALEEAILSAEPVKPSQRDLGNGIAAARSSLPRKLAHSLAGDLDTITLQALKKKPAERYATADAFLKDLRRYLAGEPVLARPDSRVYRLKKFVARHKFTVTVAAVTSFALLGATTVSIWQAQAAREQARVARRETRRAQAVQEFLLDIFRTNSVQQPDPQRARQTTARELLDVGAARVAESLSNAPEAQNEVQDTLADMYYQLGLYEDAGRMRLQRIEVLKGLYGSEDMRVAAALLQYARDVSESDARGLAAQPLSDAQRIVDASGDTDPVLRGRLWLELLNFQQYTSLAGMRDNAARALHFFREHPVDWDLFRSLQAVGRACYLSGDFACAQVRHREALAEAERRLPGDSAWIITPLAQLAEAETGALQFSLAEAHFRHALAICRKLQGDLYGTTLQTQAKLGGFLHAYGSRAEGRRILQDTLGKLGMQEANATPNAVGTFNWIYGVALVSEGRLAEGERFLAADIADLREHYPESIPLARDLQLQSAAFTAMGRYRASAQVLDEALRIWLQVGSGAAERSAMNPFLFAQIALLLAQGNAAAAIEKTNEIASRKDADHLPLPIDAVRTRILLAQAYLLENRALDARESARQALSSIQRSAVRENYAMLEADAALRLGQARQRMGELPQARIDLEHALELRTQLDDPGSPWLAEVRIALADCLLDLKDRNSARQLIEQAAAAYASHSELGEHWKTPLRKVSARL